MQRAFAPHYQFPIKLIFVMQNLMIWLFAIYSLFLGFPCLPALRNKQATCVPNIMTPEGRMWIYYRSCEYINCGIKAIHFGQVWLIGALDCEKWEV